MDGVARASNCIDSNHVSVLERLPRGDDGNGQDFSPRWVWSRIVSIAAGFGARIADAPMSDRQSVDDPSTPAITSVLSDGVQHHDPKS